MRPGRSSAGSRTSGKLVVKMKILWSPQADRSPSAKFSTPPGAPRSWSHRSCDQLVLDAEPELLTSHLLFSSTNLALPQGKLLQRCCASLTNAGRSNSEHHVSYSMWRRKLDQHCLLAHLILRATHLTPAKSAGTADQECKLHAAQLRAL